ncbi:MAG: hypothetical protein WC712_04815 [Candidatus Brocadiia bacterium]
MIDEARALAMIGKVEQGLAVIAKAAGLQVSGGTRKEIDDAQALIGGFDRVLRFFPVSPVISGGQLVSLKLKGGGTVEGVVEREDDIRLVVRNFGGVSVTVKKSDIAQRRVLSPGDFQNANRAVLTKMLDDARRYGTENWLSWLKAFKLARKYDLNPEQWKVYTEMCSRWVDNTTRVADYEAFQLYRRALAYYSKGLEKSAVSTAEELLRSYSGSSYASSARELLDRIRGVTRPAATPEPNPTKPTPSRSDAPPPSATPTPAATSEPPVQNVVLSPPKASTQTLKDANEAYLAGEELIRKAFAAMEEDNYENAMRLFDEAIVMLEKARSLYEAELSVHPNRTDVEDFIEQVNKLLYLSRKSRPVGTWK